MLGGTQKHRVATLAVLACLAGASLAGAQQFDPAGYPAPPEYVAAAPAAPGQSISNTSAADVSPDLAARVKDLESALKKIKDKEAAAKTKAALRPSVVPSGRLQFDGVSFYQNATSVQQLGRGALPPPAANDAFTAGTDVGNIPSGVGVRRARLALAGDAFEVVNYQLEFDFAGSWNTANTSFAGFRDVYIGVKELPYIGNFRVGHFKEPFGLEELTSDNFTTFMERATADEGALVPARNLGAMAFNTYAEDRGTWAIGAFASDPQHVDTPPSWFSDEGGYAATMRATYLLWYDEASDGRGLLHVGGAYSYRDNDPRVNYRFRARPEVGLSPRVLDLSLPNVDHLQLLGGELAGVYGPFSVQAEYFLASIDRDPPAGASTVDPNFDGFYVFFSYFLTGEHRPYRKSSGCFDRIRPYENFFRVRDCDGCVRTGKGAWEVGYRYSYLDLLDGLPTDNPIYRGAGYIGDHTFGLTWYLNPYCRAMMNYVYTDMARVTGDGATPATSLIGGGHMETIEGRFQIDF